MTSSTLDLSQPLSDILRQSTKEAHDGIAFSPEAAKLSNGELSKTEYVRFLMMLWHIYAALEEGLERHATHPVLEPTYNPPLLRRAPSLSSDIAQLLQVSESTWKSHPIHQSLITSPPKAMSTYVNRIHDISNSGDPTPLVAHAYVRYLGDLSGGQTIRHSLAKAYDLDEASGEGLSFYAFKELSSSKPASLGEMKRIKDWFRNGMNEGAGDNTSVKAVIAQEAKDVFRYNGDLFNAILEDPEQVRKDSPVTPKAQYSSGIAVSSVLAVITAVSVAHFFLVAGGFSGPRGFAKLAAAEQWFTSFWGSTVQ
ncbi:heme oxygenase [Lentinula edodes]|uniref:heme oxygenase (biliverdin-producing) n=1 Tax=Lentinula edodes TaxID=5353 RepID=A0A1Q3E4U0_LENED|nr:uncharacterized protein C8R40DRAFT_1101127 [Lentinula edodes]KAH7876208.1 hypothetical protein C8R40DRAFT_1101127 [Lentinula edodes]KAJ3919271.1 hypothetical protein F5877DRAFT_40726 [Lentinula edodes]GAW02255.1 heme oxygenase [Lentinula edodes]